MATRPMRYPPEQHLSAEECWPLLASTAVGRLALLAPDYPELFPVNFVVDRDTLVIRTDPGTKYSAAMGRAAATLEADGYLRSTNEAWSVVVKGRLEPIADDSALLKAESLALYPWQFGPKARFIRVIPHIVTGRRFVVVEPSHWSAQTQREA